MGLEPTTYRLTAGCSAVELLRNTNWLRPTLPGPCGPSTIGDEELNCCVRDGNRCILFSIIAILVFFNNLEFSIIFIDEININKFLILCQYINFSQILTFLYSVCTLKTAYHNPKLGQVLDLLVLISYIHYCTYTLSLSTT